MDLGRKETAVTLAFPKPESKPKKRKRLKPMSDKRREQIPARQAAVAEAMRRDGERCQWPIRAAGVEGLRAPLRCFGPLTPHEPKGARNVDRTDPDEIVTLCLFHNEACEDYPADARRLGLRPENRNAVGN